MGSRMANPKEGGRIAAFIATAAIQRPRQCTSVLQLEAMVFRPTRQLKGTLEEGERRGTVVCARARRAGSKVLGG